MAFYHSWIYENILNNQWIVWGIVIFVLFFNVISPVVIWFMMSGRKLFKFGKKEKKEKSG